MNGAGSGPSVPNPLWLLAELTYRCPLQCPYCSNPLDLARYTEELSTDEWLRVLREARALGAVQLGFSGGEPLVRRDLEVLITEAHRLGYYTNLITSGIGMDEARVCAFREAGLDHIQLSFQASTAELNDFLAGTRSFTHKQAMAATVKRLGYPMVLNVVLHRHNIDQTRELLDLAEALQADYVELANTQYYGWALLNRDLLLPTREQLEEAEAVAREYKARLKGRMQIYFVVPDYYEQRPKACMGGWGAVFLTVAPDGLALPCQGARQIGGIEFPNVREQSIADVWYRSPAFNRFRGFDWMQEPCRTCPERAKDFGGCRCQAFQLTGNAAAADPVCALSPQHHLVETAVAAAQHAGQRREQSLVFRNLRNARARSG